MTHISTAIVVWRREQLTRVGYSEQDASALAEHGEIPSLVQRALSRPTLQELFLSLLAAQKIELEQLYVGPRPTTLFFLAVLAAVALRV